MRISNQYLPMMGSSDPTATAESEYYRTSLAIMKKIADNTGEGAKAAKNTADSVQ